MNKNLVIFGVAVLLICIGLSGCNEEKKDSNEEIDMISKFIGTWDSTSTLDGVGYSITFFSNGTWSIYNGESGTYALKEGKLKLKNNLDISYLYDFSFSNNDNTLIITEISGGLSEILNKQQNEE